MKFLMTNNTFLSLRNNNGVRNGEEGMNSVVRTDVISTRSFSFD